MSVVVCIVSVVLSLFFWCCCHKPLLTMPCTSMTSLHYCLRPLCLFVLGFHEFPLLYFHEWIFYLYFLIVVVVFCSAFSYSFPTLFSPIIFCCSVLFVSCLLSFLSGIVYFHIHIHLFLLLFYARNAIFSSLFADTRVLLLLFTLTE